MNFLRNSGHLRVRRAHRLRHDLIHHGRPSHHGHQIHHDRRRVQ
jgi:hypothetical protein